MEPLGALVAIAAVAFGLALYAGFVVDVLPGTSDRSIEDATIERVWHAIADQGVYDRSAIAVDEQVLPDGHYVEIYITESGNTAQVQVHENVVYNPDGEISHQSLESPEHAMVATRPISIRHDPGDVRGGRLHVVVWK